MAGHFSRRFAAVLIGTVLLLGANLTAASADQSTPKLSVTVGPSGTTVAAAARDWSGCSYMSISGWGQTLVDRGTIDQGGRFYLTFKVPAIRAGCLLSPLLSRRDQFRRRRRRVSPHARCLATTGIVMCRQQGHSRLLPPMGSAVFSTRLRPWRGSLQATTALDRLLLRARRRQSSLDGSYRPPITETLNRTYFWHSVGVIR
jgi:hypothetical protein